MRMSAVLMVLPSNIGSHEWQSFRHDIVNYKHQKIHNLLECFKPQGSDGCLVSRYVISDASIVY